MTMGPLERAREALHDAQAKALHSPSGANLQALEEAQAHMDYLLDTLPIPRTPEGPGASHPGPSVSHFVVGGEHWPDDQEDGCTVDGQQSSEGER